MTQQNKCLSRPGFELRLNIRDLQLGKIIGLEYIKKIFDIGYGMKNYVKRSSSTRLKMKLQKIRRYLILGLEKL